MRTILLPLAKWPRQICAILLCALAGCTQTPHVTTATSGAAQAKVNNAQVPDVLEALEVGEVARARKILKSMAKHDKNDQQVKLLRETIDGDPVAMLGAKSFLYTVRRGDNISELSQRFLGDRRKLFLLVRYNGLKSGILAAGQVLRIPGSAPPPPPPPIRPRPETRPIKPSPTPHSQQKAPVAQKTDSRGAAVLRGQGLSALNQGRVADAVALLRRAKALDPANSAIKGDLARAEKVLATVKKRK